MIRWIIIAGGEACGPWYTGKIVGYTSQVAHRRDKSELPSL